MTKLVKDSIKVIETIKEQTNNSPDIIIKTITFFNHYVHIIFNESLSNSTTINEYILEFFEKERKIKSKQEDIIKYLIRKLPTRKTTKIDNYDELFYNLLSGFTIVLVEGFEEALSIETKQQLDSGIAEATAESIIKGPKDAFSENYQTNIGLIRKRIKTESLWLEELIIGTKSKTKIGIMYVNDVVDKNLVDYLKKKISDINIDSIPDSNYIIELISENQRNVFPNYLSTERPDLVAKHLLDGRVAIIVENTQYAVIVPITFFEFFHSTEDFYQKVINVNYYRIIRFIALTITLLVPSLYIAVTTHNHETIPDALLINLASQRQGVPFPAIIEIFLMLITFEILKESDLRTPQKLGSSLAIVGALVLGDAAVQAGIVSPIMVIVVAITAISGLIISTIEFTNGVKWWRFLFIVLAAFEGLIGLLIVSVFFIINVSSIKSFGIPYLEPYAPFDIKNQNNGIFVTNKAKFFNRNTNTAKKNIKRTSKGKR